MLSVRRTLMQLSGSGVLVDPGEPIPKLDSSDVDIGVHCNVHVFIVPLHDRNDFCVVETANSGLVSVNQERMAFSNIRDLIQDKTILSFVDISTNGYILIIQGRLGRFFGEPLTWQRELD
jgi:hypothetical protein